MSYNTRRTGGAPAAGRTSTPATQVNYHQQPATRTGATQSRNPGYSTTPQTGYNSTGYNTQSQPAFTTQPPAQPAPPVQQKPVQPTPPVQPSTPAPKPQAQPQQTPPPVKQEPITPAGTPQNTSTTTEATENGEAPAPKPAHWKKPHFKISNKARRARQNARLRRTLNPKTALTFLNELRPQSGGLKFVVREEAGWGFMASVDIDGKIFSGHGLTINKAKSVAAEQALKYLLLERMSKARSAPSAPASKEKEGDQDGKKEGNEQDEKMDVETKEGEGEPEAKKAKAEDNYENELPWGSLAAFALHKLFTEWQREGITEWQRESVEMPYPDKFEEETSEDHFPARRTPGPGPVDEYGYAAPGPRRFRPFPPRGRGFGPFPGPRGPPPNFRMPRAPGPPPAALFLGGNFKPGFPVGGAAKPLALLPMRKIPDDANTRHPVMLLNQLKPQVVYNEEKEGEPPRDNFKITVEHNGQEFVGRAKSKKEAKKRAAKAVLATMGVHYPDDD